MHRNTQHLLMQCQTHRPTKPGYDGIDTHHHAQSECFVAIEAVQSNPLCLKLPVLRILQLVKAKLPAICILLSHSSIAVAMKPAITTATTEAQS